MRISVFDYLKSTIMVQKLHVGIVLEWFWPADFRNTIIGVILNGKQIYMLGFVKAFIPFKNKYIKRYKFIYKTQNIYLLTIQNVPNYGISEISRSKPFQNYPYIIGP